MGPPRFIEAGNGRTPPGGYSNLKGKASGVVNGRMVSV